MDRKPYTGTRRLNLEEPGMAERTFPERTRDSGWRRLLARTLQLFSDFSQQHFRSCLCTRFMVGFILLVP